ncbi:hypothetical protein GGR57DRAFT_482296 [Xylariaceae sp. FL1272]|nr:hypothetical protein GGR57DRAFT_482296 [Xylariaceae sp. FL1272]
MGSGIWGEELNTYNRLVFERLIIDPRHQRRGIAKAAVKAAIDAARGITDGKPLVAFANPEPLTEEVGEWAEKAGLFEHATKEQRIQYFDEAEKVPPKFWRALGFRKVGYTSFVAYATDPNHLCHVTEEDSDEDE